MPHPPTVKIDSTTAELHMRAIVFMLITTTPLLLEALMMGRKGKREEQGRSISGGVTHFKQINNSSRAALSLGEKLLIHI